MRNTDILIIGSGAIGAACGYFLSKRGYKVLIIDKNGIAAGASGAAEGIVGSVTKRTLGLVTSLVVESFKMFPALSEELGIDIEFDPKAGLTVIDEEDRVDLLKRFVDKKRKSGPEIEFIDKVETLDREPMLSDHIIGGIYTPNQGIVNPIVLTNAYVEAARKFGAEFSYDCPQEFTTKNGRIISVKTIKEKIAPQIVINAAGNEAEIVAKMAGLKILIVPKRVHMIVSEPLPAKTLNNTIYCAKNLIGGLNPKTFDFEDTPEDKEVSSKELENPWQLSSCIQTKNGTILFCGGFSFSEGRTCVDLNLINKMANNINEIFPMFRFFNVVRSWAGMEPCTPDNEPIIGKAPNLENFYFAAGHGNAGIMMSPATGLAIAELISDGKSRLPLDAAEPGRFENVQ